MITVEFEMTGDNKSVGNRVDVETQARKMKLKSLKWISMKPIDLSGEEYFNQVKVKGEEADIRVFLARAEGVGYDKQDIDEIIKAGK
jgi:hypothetical protein